MICNHHIQLLILHSLLPIQVNKHARKKRRNQSLEPSTRVERGEVNIFYSKIKLKHKSSTLCMQFRFSPGALHL
ncbi:hypothetical protein L1987_29396 [Smallanthus sonchifolius]|uniref:Uncharacterized protein n=1 Tax=Smallanthus sonchifolius TaxID=185202 RepID=A0ACB9HZS1_9ASTR|nr:hypothetical protein L1987_29396 [Smallanthus sonchifolius]